MLKPLFEKLFGNYNEKELKKLYPILSDVNRWEEEYSTLSEDQIKAKTQLFKDRIATDVRSLREQYDDVYARMQSTEVAVDLEKKKIISLEFQEIKTQYLSLLEESLDRILPEAFALVKVACKKLLGEEFDLLGKMRVWDMVPFDVQVIGGVVLHKGRIAEMKTGEGKTFVATMPLYLNALAGRGAHLVTVNEYLAKRDSEWMGYLYRYLGLSVGAVMHDMDPIDRRMAYSCDITYGTNNELGFDYLRDNMASQSEQIVQRDLAYAIVDEVDSILIDEARTPLIISAPAEESTSKYQNYAKMVMHLTRDKHFLVDEKMKAVTLTEDGIRTMEGLMGVSNIYTEAGFREVHHIEQALKAHALFRKDVDYLVRDGQVMIVDEFTGRVLDGRRYSDGLHQAIEAKEQVDIKRESRTLATISFQNLFRIYDKLGGMTGTAFTEAEEFSQIYGLDVMVLPTNRPVGRKDRADVIFKTEQGKYEYIAGIVQEKHKVGQPVLIGTTSIEKSEKISELLAKRGVSHTVLNAKFHEKEAEIVSQAGKKGAVTIATNMAGRGTDIKIDDDVVEVGGLAVYGTERHESRRIDNQLRGRSGRQGDPGESQFFVSMDDDLMRIFGGDRMKNMMTMLKVPEDMPIENRLISDAIENAQKRVENYNFDIRKHLVEYDSVMNKHREIFYSRRKHVLVSTDVRDEMLEMMKRYVHLLVAKHTSESDNSLWNRQEILEVVNALCGGIRLSMKDVEEYSERDDLSIFLNNALAISYEAKEKDVPTDVMRAIEKNVYLRSMDVLWMEHLDYMSSLRQSVSLRGYAQKDPLSEYKGEAFHAFMKLLDDIVLSTVNTIFRIEIEPHEFKEFVQRDENGPLTTNQEQIEEGLSSDSSDEISHIIGDPSFAPSDGAKTHVHAPKPLAKNASYADTERNDPCPCGSGLKFKKCHGK